MIFMCLMEYPDHASIARLRPEHRAYMNGLLRDATVISAGSFLPDDDGGLFLYEADSLAEARKLVENDPYIKSRIVRSYRLTQYEIHGANPALLRVSTEQQ